MAKRIMYDPSTITEDTPVFVKKGDGVVTTEGSGTNTVAQGGSTVPIYIGGKYAGYTVKNINPELGVEVVIDDSGATRWLPYNVNERLVPYITVSGDPGQTGYGLDLLGAVAAGITDPIDYANWDVSEQTIKDAEALIPYYDAEKGTLNTTRAYREGVSEDIIGRYVPDFVESKTAPSDVIPTDTDQTPTYSDRVAPYVSASGSLDPFSAVAAGVTDLDAYEGFGLTQENLDEISRLLKYRDPDTKEFRLDDAIEDGWTVDQLGTYFDMSKYQSPEERPVDPVYTKAGKLGVLNGSNIDVTAALDKGMSVAELKTLGVPEESIVEAQAAIENNERYAPYITKNKKTSYIDVDKAVADLNEGKLTKEDLKALGISDENVRLANLRLKYKTEDGQFDLFRAAEDNVSWDDLASMGFKNDDIQTAKDMAYMSKHGIDLKNFSIVDAVRQGIPDDVLLRSTNTTLKHLKDAKNYLKVEKFYDEDGHVSILGAIDQNATNAELRMLGFTDADIKKGRAISAAQKTMDAGGYWLDDAKTQPNYDKLYEDGKLSLLSDLYEDITPAMINKLTSEYKNSTKVGDSYIANSVLNDYFKGWDSMGFDAKQKSNLLDTIAAGDTVAYNKLFGEYNALRIAKQFWDDTQQQQAFVDYVKDDYGTVDPKKIDQFVSDYNRAHVTGWIKQNIKDKDRQAKYLQIVRAGDYAGFDREYRQDLQNDFMTTVPDEYKEMVRGYLDDMSNEEFGQFVNDWTVAQAKMAPRKLLEARKQMLANGWSGVKELAAEVWNAEKSAIDATTTSTTKGITNRPDFASNAQLMDYTPGLELEVTSESKPWGEAIKNGPSNTNNLRNWVVEQVDSTVRDSIKLKDLNTFSEWLGTEVGKVKSGDMTQQDAFHDVAVLTQFASSWTIPGVSSFRLAQSIADKADIDPSIAENADKIANYAYALANVIATLEDVEQSRTDDIAKNHKVWGVLNKVLDEAYVFDIADMAMISLQLIGHGADYVSGFVNKDGDQTANAQAAITDTIAGLLTYPMSVPNTIVTDTPQGVAELAALILPGLPDIGKKVGGKTATNIRRVTLDKMFDIKNIVTGAKLQLNSIPTNVKWIDVDPKGEKTVVLPIVEGKIAEVSTPGFVSDQFGTVVGAGTLKDSLGREVGYTKYQDSNSGTTYLLNAEDGSKSWDIPANQLMWTALQSGVEQNVKSMPFNSTGAKPPVTVVYGNYRLTDDGNGVSATFVRDGKAFNYMTTDRYSSYKDKGLTPINVTDRGVKSRMFNKHNRPSGILQQVFDARDAYIGDDGHLRPDTTHVSMARTPDQVMQKSKDPKAVRQVYARTAKEIAKVLIDPRLTKGAIQKVKDALGDNVHAKAQLEYALTHMSPEDAKKVVEWAKRPALKELLENGEYYKFNRLLGLDKVEIAPTKTYEVTSTESSEFYPGNPNATDKAIKDEFQRIGYEGLKDADDVASSGYRTEDLSPNLLADELVNLIISHPEWETENRLLQRPDMTLYDIFMASNSELKEAIYAKYPELRQDSVIKEKLIVTKVVENPVIPESKEIAKGLLEKISKIKPKQLRIRDAKSLGGIGRTATAKTLLALMESLPKASKHVGKVLAPLALAVRMAMPVAASADMSLTTPVAITQTIDGSGIAAETSPSTVTKTETVTETVTETRNADIHPEVSNKIDIDTKSNTESAAKAQTFKTNRAVSESSVTDVANSTQLRSQQTTEINNGIKGTTTTENRSATDLKTERVTKSDLVLKTKAPKTETKAEYTTDVDTQANIDNSEVTESKITDVQEQKLIETPVHTISQTDVLQNVLQNNIQQYQSIDGRKIDEILRTVLDTNIKIKNPEDPTRTRRTKFPHHGGISRDAGDENDAGPVMVAWRQGSLTVKGKKRPVWIVIRKKGNKMVKSYEYQAPKGAKVLNGKPHQTLYATKKRIKPFKVKVGFNTVTVDLRKTGKDRLEFKRTRKEVSGYKLPTQNQLSANRIKFR